MLETFLKKVMTNTETKPFYTTSEFWVVVGAAINTVITGPQNTESLVLNAIAGIYAVSRGLAKSGSNPTPGGPSA
jgi:hypothetical protein